MIITIPDILLYHFSVKFADVTAAGEEEFFESDFGKFSFQAGYYDLNVVVRQPV